MGAYNGGVEHLHQVRRRAQACQCIEESLKNTGFAQALEPFPHAVPVAETFRQGPPANVLDRKEMQGLKKQPVVRALATSPRQTRPKDR